MTLSKILEEVLQSIHLVKLSLLNAVPIDIVDHFLPDLGKLYIVAVFGFRESSSGIEPRFFLIADLLRFTARHPDLIDLTAALLLTIFDQQSDWVTQLMSYLCDDDDAAGFVWL